MNIIWYNFILYITYINQVNKEKVISSAHRELSTIVYYANSNKNLKNVYTKISDIKKEKTYFEKVVFSLKAFKNVCKILIY